MFTDNDLRVMLVSALVLLAIMIDMVRIPKHKARLSRAEIARIVNEILNH